jgi:TrmH family RNA methyltransferase
MEQVTAALLKDFLKLSQKKERSSSYTYAAEGRKTIQALMALGHRPRWVAATQAEWNFWQGDRGFKGFLLSSAQAERMSFLKTAPGIVAVFDLPEPEVFPSFLLEDVVIADGISDPGNLGTLIRTMHWFGIKNLWFTEGTADPFQPKAVQASMGSIGAMKVLQSTAQEARLWLEEKKIAPFVLRLEGSWSLPPAGPKVWVLGAEAHGVGPSFQAFGIGLKLPPFSNLPPESLNVSVSFACLMGAIHLK